MTPEADCSAMGALTRHPGSSFRVPEWQAEVTQLLDEHHLVAWSPLAARRVHFAASLAQFLGGLREAEVVTFFGRFITDLESFCYQAERALVGPTLERRIDGPGGLATLLRFRQEFRGRPASKYRYYIWHDADTLLKSDRKLFGRIVETIAGVGAESEYASDDVLLIHRAVFVGGPALDVYAEDQTGQFQHWSIDEHPEPFWQVVTGVERPPMLRYQVDQLGG
jgi:hypothetical protein